MHIMQISTMYRLGGAARAAWRQHVALKHLGEQSSMFVLIGESGAPEVQAYDYAVNFPSRVRRRLRYIYLESERGIHLRQGRGKAGIFSDGRSHLGSTATKQIRDCDLVNLHWISGFIDYGTLAQQVGKTSPIVWTLHDMNAFTGGCHYSHGCQAFKNKCGKCWQLHRSYANDLSRRTWKRKKKAFEKIDSKNIRIVTPSHWLAGLARKSSLFEQFDIQVIPYCLDINEFTPGIRDEARRRVSIDYSGPLVIFVASGLEAERKGLDYLVRALQEIRKDLRPGLLTVGVGQLEIPDSIAHVHIEGITEPKELANIYIAADIMVAPYLEDNLPLAVQEALACGIPVIAFDTGGLSDMVIQQQSGMLVDRYDVRGLSSCIDRVINDCSLQKQLAFGARKLAEDRFSEIRNATAYRRVYEDLLAGD